MKPIFLNICAWGPYMELQTISFDAFYERGIFLITGVTGAGKTTVFDAITYALYGNVSGLMREKDSLRSDFANADAKTYVEFVFSHLGKEYKIYRNPEYFRPKKRRTGAEELTKEKERAILYFPDGAALEGNNEVNRKIEEILGMDYRQFKQISMIAQGEFIRLLTANQKEKTEIFKEIFDTVLCENFTQAIRKRASLLQNEIMTLRSKMEENIENLPMQGQEWELLREKGVFACDAILNYLKQEEKSTHGKKKEEEQKLAIAETEIEQLLQQMEEQKRIKSLFQKKEEAVKAYEEHKLFKEVCEQKKKRLDAAKKVQELLPQEKEFAYAKEQLFQAKKKEEELLCAYEEAKRQGEEIKSLYQKKEDVESLFTDWLQYLESIKEQREKKEKLKQLEKKLEGMQNEYLSLEESVRKKQEDYQRAEDSYRRAMIGVVARMVEEGRPCPVCGSLEHPQIAATEGSVPKEEELETRKNEIERLRARQMEYHAGTLLVKNEKENDSLELKKLSEEIIFKGNEVQKMIGFLKPLENIIYKYLKIELPEEVSLGQTGALESAKQKWKDCIELETRRQADTEAKLEFLKGLQEERKKSEEQYDRVEKEWKQELKKYGYKEAESFEKDKMTQEDIQNIEAEIEEYIRKRNTLKDYKEHLEGETKELKQVFSLEQEHTLEEKREEKAVILQRKTELEIKESRMEEVSCFLKEKQKKLRKKEKEYGIFGELENLVLGRNPKRLLLEQYVLLGYFDAILEAANVRMRKMTMGRYVLYRAKESSDGRKRDNLEMEVLDNYTGRYRSVKTLSGGELFNTSLALALGLSDIIQLNNGGISVETLFIDEGFGALDEHTLEQACDTLLHLTQKSGMIGIISHVRELKDKIGNQIIVEKTNRGSHIRLQRE